MNRWMQWAIGIALVAITLGSCSGCSTAELEDDAARRTHAVIAPAYRSYVEADERLEEGQLEVELSWLQRWAKAVDAADRPTERTVHAHVAPRYVGYVEADPKLDEDQKARRTRHVKAWGMRLEEER